MGILEIRNFQIIKWPLLVKIYHIIPNFTFQIVKNVIFKSG